MGILTRAISERLPDFTARRSTVERGPGTMATASGIDALRRAKPGSAATYRNWSIHGELVRAAFDVKLGQLARAEWDIVPFDNSARKPDKGTVSRMREILSQPNPGETSTGSFLTAVGEDILCLDAGAFEFERTLRGDIVWLWPTDGGAIQIDRLWQGDPKMPRFYYCPEPTVAVPLYNFDLGYIKMHSRSYSPLGIPPLETLKMTIDAELQGSMYNHRQVTQAAPDGIMDLGENARPDQVEGFKSLWDNLIAGKSMMAFWGGTKSAKFIPFKRTNHEMQFMEWQMYCVRKLCAVLQISPQDLGFTFDINKSTSETQQDQTDERGTFPFLGAVQDAMTSQFCWDPSFGGRNNNIAFRFRGISERATAGKAATHKLTLAGMPSQTINEARRDMGYPPIGDPNDENNPFNQLMANTPLGLVLLDKIPSAYDVTGIAKDERAQELQDSAPAPAPVQQIKAGLEFEDLITKMDLQHNTALTALAAMTRPTEVKIDKGALEVNVTNQPPGPTPVTVTTNMPEPAVAIVRQIRRATTYKHSEEGLIIGKVEVESDAMDPTYQRVLHTKFLTDMDGNVIGKEEFESAE